MYGEETEIQTRARARVYVRVNEKQSEIDRERVLCTARQETGASDKDEDAA